ncbi:MAG: hypothetical protein IGBAC_1464 [Ignavibacteriae bacterium]|nr:MAG: hypothetical protein IGBAC_1464 [Ignavibacteriota bacterium]
MNLENSSQIVVDLHLHTNYSDGKLSPIELLDKVKQLNIQCVGIVDHDNVDGLDEAIEYAKKLNIELIPGVELSSSIGDIDVHILGYFIDHKNKNLLEHLHIFKEERIKRARRIIDKLQKMNIPLEFESLLEKSKNSALGRPHIATAMVENGYVGSYQEAFDNYIRNGGPAYEAKYTFSPKQAIKLINQCGGLSFIAHPSAYLEDNIISQLIELGIDGIEIIHPSHPPAVVDMLHKTASEYFLLESGGSDYHGGLRGDEEALGRYTIPYKYINAMKKRLYLSQ